MDNELLDGFYLKDLLVLPLKGEIQHADKSTHLPSRAMEVLLVLAKNPRRLVTREELITRVWGDADGHSDALSHAVSEIRHALSDRPASPIYIQTVPRRGYRLLAEPKASASRAQRNENHASGFWSALLRHGVVQAAAAYLVAGWLLIQIADATFDNLGLPAWSEQFVTYAVVLGFPIVLLLSWFFEFAQGKLSADRGEQSSGLFEGLERNYLAVFIAFGAATLAVGVYQATVGLGDPDSDTTAAREDPFNDPRLIPVADNSLAVLQLATPDNHSTAQLFARGLSEDLIDGLAMLPGLFVSAKGDSWSLSPVASSENVRRRLRVAFYLAGSVRSIDDQLRVAVQLIDSNTGFHVVSRSFEYDVDDYSTLQEEVAQLVVANLRPVLDNNNSELKLLATDATSVDAYILYRQGQEILQQPVTETSLKTAIGFFNAALQVDARYPAALAGLCKAHAVLFQNSDSPEDIAMAEAACGSAYETAPNLPLVLHSVGRLHILTGNYTAAETIYRRALQINEQDAAALLGLATVFQRAQKLDEAEALMIRAVEQQPGNWQTYNSLGWLYFRTGRYNEAAEQYKRVVYLDPENFAALGNLGSASLMSGQFDQAQRAIEHSLQIEPDSTMYSNLGIVHYFLGEFDASVGMHRKAVQSSPDSPANWLNLADALHFSGDDAAASAAFDKVIEHSKVQLAINASDPETLTLLAWAESMTGDRVQAIELALRAISIDPGDPYSHYYLALTYINNNQIERALDAIASAVENGYSAEMLAADPYLKPLLSNPQFSDILSKQAE